MEQQLTIQTADAMELNMPIAGVGGRSYAYLIDWHIRVIFVLLWLLGIPTLFGRLASLIDFFREITDASTLTMILFFAPPFIVYFLYHPILEILMKGRTPGKKIAGIRIVTTEGHTPGIGALLIRNIFRLIDSMPSIYLIGLVTCMTTAKAVRVGDIAAGTLLVYEDNVNKKLFSNMQGLQQDQLTPQQWDVVHELLERWQGLEEDHRVQLASKLCRQLGIDDSHADTLSASRKDKFYKQALKGVLQGE